MSARKKNNSSIKPLLTVSQNKRRSNSYSLVSNHENDGSSNSTNMKQNKWAINCNKISNQILEFLFTHTIGTCAENQASIAPCHLFFHCVLIISNACAFIVDLDNLQKQSSYEKIILAVVLDSSVIILIITGFYQISTFKSNQNQESDQRDTFEFYTELWKGHCEPTSITMMHKVPRLFKTISTFICVACVLYFVVLNCIEFATHDTTPANLFQFGSYVSFNSLTIPYLFIWYMVLYHAVWYQYAAIHDLVSKSIKLAKDYNQNSHDWKLEEEFEVRVDKTVVAASNDNDTKMDNEPDNAVTNDSKLDEIVSQTGMNSIDFKDCHCQAIKDMNEFWKAYDTYYKTTFDAMQRIKPMYLWFFICSAIGVGFHVFFLLDVFVYSIHNQDIIDTVREGITSLIICAILLPCVVLWCECTRIYHNKLKNSIELFSDEYIYRLFDADKLGIAHVVRAKCIKDLILKKPLPQKLYFGYTFRYQRIVSFVFSVVVLKMLYYFYNMTKRL